ncbi:hypothetical protein ACJX0J_016335, partial [Zea mays]
RRPVASRNKQEKEPKKPRKTDNIENMMNKYLEMRSNQVEDEAAPVRAWMILYNNVFHSKEDISNFVILAAMIGSTTKPGLSLHVLQKYTISLMAFVNN